MAYCTRMNRYAIDIDLDLITGSNREQWQHALSNGAKSRCIPCRYLSLMLRPKFLSVSPTLHAPSEIPPIRPTLRVSLSIDLDHQHEVQHEVDQITRSVIPMADSPPSHDVSTPCRSLLFHSNALSVSPISPSPRSESESNIQQEPVTIAYATVFQITSCVHYSTPPLRLFSLYCTLDSHQEPCST